MLTSPPRARTRSLATRRYVDYLLAVDACPSCQGDGPTRIRGLPVFYMNGDWMAYEPQAEEMTNSGPIMASFHSIKDVGLVAKFAALLGKATDAAHYGRLESELKDTFNELYLLHNASTDGWQYGAGGQTENAVPAAAGFAPSAVRTAAAADVGARHSWEPPSRPSRHLCCRDWRRWSEQRATRPQGSSGTSTCCKHWPRAIRRAWH